MLSKFKSVIVCSNLLLWYGLHLFAMNNLYDWCLQSNVVFDLTQMTCTCIYLNFHCIFFLGLGEVDMELIKKVKSIREMFILLQENKLFTQTDVILMQYLLKQAECKDLNNECIKYARKQRSLCFFEKPPGTIFISNTLHAFWKRYLFLSFKILITYSLENKWELA